MSPDFAARLFAFGLAACGLALALHQIASELAYAPAIALSSHLRAGLVPETSFWSKIDRDGAADGADCNDRGVRARLTVSLARLDSFSRGGTLQERDSQRLASISAARHAIACAPMNGDAWFRLGLLELGTEGPTPEVIAAFDQADRLAPSEGWLIQIRAPIYADLANRRNPAFRDRAIRDVRVFTAFGHDPARALNWLAAWPDLLRSGFMRGLALVSLRERRWYFSLASGFGVDIGQEGKGEIIIDPFTGKPFNRDLDR